MKSIKKNSLRSSNFKKIKLINNKMKAQKIGFKKYTKFLGKKKAVARK